MSNWGFLRIKRKNAPSRPPRERIADFGELHPPLDEEEIRRQAQRCMNCGVPFCHIGVQWAGIRSGCPLNNLMPEINSLVAAGMYYEAWRRLKRTHPFPEFTSRVCPALCEGACTNSMEQEAVAIREVERFLSDKSFEEGWEKPGIPGERTGKRIAVIGSGPAGLAAAWALNRLGHTVTVYEKSDRPGGLLTYGIPEMKLPKKIVERRIKLLEQEGIAFITNAPVDSAETAAEIRKAHDAVVLACGTGIRRDLAVPGRDLEGIMQAVDYLSDATVRLLAGKPQRDLTGKHVVIIGGGDTGNDCVATAIRQNAASVVQLEIMPAPPASRTPDNPWPRWPLILKTDYGQQEAIALFGRDPRIYCMQTTSFEGENGRVKSLNAVSVEWKNVDGRRMPVTVPGSERVFQADLVLLAMGFIGADPAVFEAFGANPAKSGQGGGGIFAAGDMKTGQSLVCRAMANALETADAVDEYLYSFNSKG